MIETHLVMRKGKCRHCGADGSGNMENLVKINSCRNCMIDIQMKGHWTGDGWHAWGALWKKHTREEMLKYCDENIPMEEK